jgi:hypothetical protein
MVSSLSDRLFELQLSIFAKMSYIKKSDSAGF